MALSRHGLRGVKIVRLHKKLVLRNAHVFRACKTHSHSKCAGKLANCRLDSESYLVQGEHGFLPQTLGR